MRSLILIAGLMIGAAQAHSSTIGAELPQAELRGQATYRYLGLKVYRARLFTNQGSPLDWQQDFGLELTYLRSISEKALVDSTMDELKRTGPALPIGPQLAACYKSVGKGDRYLAISKGPDTVMFWRNGVQMCTLTYPDIKKRFMGIFLGDNTRSASFTRKLKGL